MYSLQLYVTGPHAVPKLPVFSFIIRHKDSGRFLHHNYVCSVLNDVFGIQSRGGCMCAGPYAQVHLYLPSYGLDVREQVAPYNHIAIFYDSLLEVL